MSMKHNKKLHQLPLFWCALFAPIAAAAFVTAKIYLSNEIGFSFATKDLKALLSTFQIPIGLAGLSIPFVAVVGAIHRSDQTSRQIASQTAQNNFANHFKHLEEFKKALAEEKIKPTQWNSFESFHRSIYPNTQNGDLEPITTAGCDQQEIKEIILEGPEPYNQIFSRLNQATRHILNHYGARTVRAESYLYHIYDLRDITENIDKAYSFAGMHESPFSLLSADWFRHAKKHYTAFDLINSNRNNIMNHLQRSGPLCNINAVFSKHHIDEDMHKPALKYLIHTLSEEELLSISNLSKEDLTEQLEINLPETTH